MDQYAAFEYWDSKNIVKNEPIIVKITIKIFFNSLFGWNITIKIFNESLLYN